jgi:leucyl-tRNA synthetase
MRRQAHQTLAKVTDDIGRRRTFNTAIAAVMELLNALAKFPQAPVLSASQPQPQPQSQAAAPAQGAGARAQDRSVAQEALEIAVLGLSPIIPHVTHVLWRALGHETTLIDEPWTAVDVAALEAAKLEIVVQVNGRLRGRITVAADADENTVRAAALADPHVQKFIGDAAVRKLIMVPGKLVNIVV